MSLAKRLLALSAASFLTTSADIPVVLHSPAVLTNVSSQMIAQSLATPPAALIGYFFDANRNGNQDEYEEASAFLGRVADPLPEGVVVSGFIPYELMRGKVVHVVLRDVLADVILMNTFMPAPSDPFLKPHIPVGVFAFETAGWKKGVLEKQEHIYIVDKLILHIPPPEAVPRSHVREMQYRELITGTRMYEFECRIDGKRAGSGTFAVHYSPLPENTPAEEKREQKK